MARGFAHYFKLGEGEKAITVGYSWTVRDGYWRVRFVDPDGKRREAATGVGKRTKEPTADAHLEAAKIITKAFRPAFPDPKRVKWEEAVEEVCRTCPDLRPATLASYRKAVKALRETMAGDKGPAHPADVTDELAGRFARLWLTATFRRGKASDAKEYKRSPRTLAYYLVALRSLWNHFGELGYVKGNPWKSVRKPQVEKKRKPAPTEADVEAFFAWVRGRYPNWEALHSLLELKAISGCRTLDICLLESRQLRDQRIVWEASQTKHKEGRAVLLPEALYAKLKSLAGPTYLWEGFADDVRKYRPGRNRLPAGYSAETVYWVLSNLFREFNEAHPDRPRLTPHALRRRAITLTVMATGGNVDATAQAIGINPQTARAYYLDAQRAFNNDEIFRKVADVLLPKSVK